MSNYPPGLKEHPLAPWNQVSDEEAYEEMRRRREIEDELRACQQYEEEMEERAWCEREEEGHVS